jgi:hypothetical protein
MQCRQLDECQIMQRERGQMCCLHAGKCLNDVDVNKAPTNAVEYADLYVRNTRITGFGIDVKMHFPCMFCAAPECLVAPLMEMERALPGGAVCKVCERGWRVPITETHCEHGVSVGKVLNFVQTVGPDPEPWFTTIYPFVVREKRGIH